MYVKTKELPAALALALAAVGYGRKDIEVMSATTYTAQSFASGDGYKAFTMAVELDGTHVKTRWGAWGGATTLDPRQVDLDDQERPLGAGQAVVKGQTGGGRPVWAQVFVHPDNLAKLLPAEVALSDDETRALYAVSGFKSFYRRELFDRLNLGAYGGGNGLILALATKGLVKVNRGGAVSVTTGGRNALAGVRVSEYSGEISR